MIEGDLVYYLWTDDYDEIDTQYEDYDPKSGYLPRLGTFLHWGNEITLIGDGHGGTHQLSEIIGLVADTELGIIRSITPTRILVHDSITLNQHWNRPRGE